MHAHVAKKKAGWRKAAGTLMLGWLAACGAHAAVGMAELPPRGEDGPVTLYYPSAAPERPVRLGALTLALAPDAPPQPGNGRLVVISHGSGGSPVVHSDLARALVQVGFVVALPQHRGDHFRDASDAGPESWKRRPEEVSRAIDAVAADARFGPLLQVDRVGVYGMSAGGHTALTLAGGRWSPAEFQRQCAAHLDEDFQSCVGLITTLHGDWLDGLKRWVAQAELRRRFGSDTAWYGHTDPRIAAIVAGVPAAADFDMATLAHPVVPLALVTAPEDRWLHPRFHSDRVLQACAGACVQLANSPGAGHGALLSPLPPGLTGLEGSLLNDPPGFDRGQMRAVDQQIVGWFQQWLLK